MSAIVKKCSVAELESAANFPILAEAYAEESAIRGMPARTKNMQFYAKLEATKLFHLFGAFVDDKLIGLITLLLPTIGHYEAMIGFSESFFVLKEYRKTGAGLKLLADAEEFCGLSGAWGHIVTAPFEGTLAEVLPHRGYEPMSLVFYKELTHA